MAQLHPGRARECRVARASRLPLPLRLRHRRAGGTEDRQVRDRPFPARPELAASDAARPPFGRGRARGPTESDGCLVTLGRSPGRLTAGHCLDRWSAEWNGALLLTSWRAVLTFQPLTCAVHVVAGAAREAGSWLSVLALAACVASALTLALTSARQEPQPLQARTEIACGTPAHARSCARNVALEAAVAIAVATDGPCTRWDSGWRAEASSAGTIHPRPIGHHWRGTSIADLQTGQATLRLA